MIQSQKKPDTGVKLVTNQGYNILIDLEDAEFVKGLTLCKEEKDYFSIRNGPYRDEKLHRIIAKRAGKDCSNQIDHDNGDKFDMRRSNLRPATNGQNRANSKLNSNNQSGYKGVHWKVNRNGTGCWYAQINFESQKIYLGRFEIAEDAARAYDSAARRMFGEFATLNFPPEVIHES